jgi:hypothetical protein
VLPKVGITFSAGNGSRPGTSQGKMGSSLLRNFVGN